MNYTRGVLLVVVLALLALSVAFVLPFLQFFLLALVLTVVFLPAQERLERRLSPSRAATVLVALASVTVVLPLLYVVRVTAADAIAIGRAIREGEVTFSGAEDRIQALVGIDVDITSALQSATGGVQFDSVVNVFGAVTHVLIGVGLTLFLLFYFLKDREAFFSWLHDRMPLSDDTQSDLYDEFDHIMKAVLLGHVLVAIVQGLLAGIGLIATGIPNATFWTVVMTVLSLLPVVGSFLVWGPAVIYLFANGQTVMAVGLALWGTVVVGVSDDYLRPIIVDRYAQINPSVIIIGVLGGIYVIGVMGIFFGPVIIGMLRATVDAFAEEFDANEMT
ncbi:AI-2E family transporter [Halobacterium sp. R2-5]|uniref:AI-2E family transporter n=1 Tax=Halobacterium sp. R2-5 TaxID=2715751 RepID=UPI001422008A|nr:AI-2E family transporter [Halobacterium sp. R2-5]NIC00040.1 AI-2E family transporter [Halobacterium sp. R2-5]